MDSLLPRRLLVAACIAALSATAVAAAAPRPVLDPEPTAGAAKKKCKKKKGKRRKCKKASPAPAPIAPITPTVPAPFPPPPGTPAPEPLRYPLDVTLAGDGSGSVFSVPTGIDCGSDCAESYDAGQTVNLTAQPNSGSVFTGWSGGCTTDPCSVTMDAPRSVTATFVAGKTLTVTITTDPGDEDGTVTSSDGGINCAKTGTGISGDCGETYLTGTMVTLTAEPDTPIASGGRVNWEGDCVGTPSDQATCDLTMSSDRSVTVSFFLT